jgi:hypothetical protein
MKECFNFFYKTEQKLVLCPYSAIRLRFTVWRADMLMQHSETRGVMTHE